MSRLCNRTSVGVLAERDEALALPDLEPVWRELFQQL